MNQGNEMPEDYKPSKHERGTDEEEETDDEPTDEEIEEREERIRKEMNATKCCWCGYDETKYYVPPYGMVCREMCASMVSIVKKVRF